MPAFVAPPPRWLWQHAPHSLKVCFYAASGFSLLTILISSCHSRSATSAGNEIAEKKKNIQLPSYVQKILDIISKPMVLALFAWFSLIIMPFARVYDIVLSVVLALVVKSFADLCISHLKNSTTYLEAAEDTPQKWWSMPPCCWWAKCVKEEPLQLKHLRRANKFIAIYVMFVPLDAFFTMIRDTAFVPPVALDDTGYCSIASTSTHAVYNRNGSMTLVVTMCGMWGVGVIATAVDLCLGPNAKAKSQLSFIRMYQLLGLLKGLVGNVFSRDLTYLEPTYPVAVITNLDFFINGTAVYDANNSLVSPTPVSTIVNCPVFDQDVMTRSVFLTFCCFWMMLIAMGNWKKFTLKHEQELLDLEGEVAEKLKQGLLHPRAPPIQQTLG